MNFLHNYNPEPIAFSIGFLDIYWYGVIIAITVIVGLLLIIRFAKKRNIDVNHIYNLLFILLVSSLVGGRIGHIIGEWDYYVNNLNELVKIWHGGLAIQGIMIMDFLVVYIYGRIKKINFLAFTDLIVVALMARQLL
ncbi:MAG: prolipoprotein diacylglyceryl transferase family protein, partial [Bacteroidota bacterium]|nr:prolipoprotein diacylglyceryl transferase family protein [Bacteroidota bacterium]